MRQGPFFYETTIRWQERRRGVLEAYPLPPITASPPQEFHGEPGYWSPEYLLLASIESCLMASFLGMAGEAGLAVSSYRSSSLAKLDTLNDHSIEFTKLTVRPVVEVGAAENQEKVLALLNEAKQECLIVEALKIPVQVEPAVNVRKTTSPQDTDRPEVSAEVAEPRPLGPPDAPDLDTP